MTRFEVLLVIPLLLVTLAGLGLRWLWRQWALRQLTFIKKAMMVVVFLGCLLALSLAGAVSWGLWLERPNQPATTDDLRILEKADALLKDESAWNRNDDRACDDDRATGKFSLFCALETACTEVLGEYDHRRAALQEVRVVVEEATQQRRFEHRLMDFNNLSETRFDDVKRVLRMSAQRVAARLKPPQPAAQR
jgi:hypothetical protein